MNILSIKAYCYSEEMAFQDDVPGTPIEPGKAYEVSEDELVPEFNLGKTVINYMDVNADNWFSSQEILVNDTPALLVDFDGREFYVPYTKREFREMLQNSDEDSKKLRQFYKCLGIHQVLHQFEKEYGQVHAATIAVRKIYMEQTDIMVKI